MNDNSAAQQTQQAQQSQQAQAEQYLQQALGTATGNLSNYLQQNPSPASTWAPVTPPSFAGQPTAFGGGTTGAAGAHPTGQAGPTLAQLLHVLKPPNVGAGAGGPGPVK
jgi:hypothetical protein